VVATAVSRAPPAAVKLVETAVAANSMAWIYQLEDVIPVPESRPNLKVGAATKA
jgi:hypothetical protein